MISGIVPLGLKVLDGIAGGDPAAGAASAASGAPSGASSFLDMLNDAANRTVGSLENAEQMSIKALQGEADTREVVDAVMSAEQALQTSIAIRDKIVTAYLEISRMAI